MPRRASPHYRNGLRGDSCGTKLSTVTISVLIPAYRCAQTITATLAAVFAQRRQPDEIIVLLDGVVDETPEKLAPFRDRLTVVVQENRGIARTRNRLVELAKGDLLAFLDADDIWHPDYLQAQERLMTGFPDAVAGFTGHLRFEGADYRFGSEAVTLGPPELTDPVSFFWRINTVSAVYGSMSYCCVRRSAFAPLGPTPFSTELSGPEDCYMLYQLAMHGPIGFQPGKLVAYRLTPGSLSVNKVRVLQHWVRAFELLETQFLAHPSAPLRKAFSRFYAQKRREFAKTLMGVGRYEDAREQLRLSLANCRTAECWVKSLGLYAAGMLPRMLQPRWPASTRQIPQTEKQNA